MRILITGGLGFIGFNLFRLLEEKGHTVYIYDKFNKESNLSNYTCPIYYNDICDEQLFFQTLVNTFVGVVVHCAAETHVDKSIQNPDLFVKNNINGTLSVLNACLRYQRINPTFKLIEVNTDEVFGCLYNLDDKPFNEESPFLPNNPYSASKAGAAALTRSYARTFGLNALTTHCCNNYGPYQDLTKLIPKVITNGINNQKIPIYGKGENLREWIHVSDHNKALLFLLEKGEFKGERYIIGSDNLLTNNQIVEEITNYLDFRGYPCKKNITYVEDRKGHDFKYACDSSKLRAMGWQPEKNFKRGIIETIEFYLGDKGLKE